VCGRPAAGASHHLDLASLPRDRQDRPWATRGKPTRRGRWTPSPQRPPAPSPWRLLPPIGERHRAWLRWVPSVVDVVRED